MANQIARSLRKRMTPQEVRLWAHLRSWRARGYHFRRQAPIGAFIVDFACLKHHLVVEIDGGQHGFHVHATADAACDSRLQELGFKVLRFWNAEVDRNFDGVLTTILAEHQESPPTALRAVPPPRAGEG